VADQVLQQFAANFARRLPAPQPPSDEPVPVVEPVAPATEVPRAAAVAQPPAAREINGLGLLWAMVRDWVHHLFGAKGA
jgi:hypothetical protein